MPSTYDHLRVLSFRLRRELIGPIRYWHIGFPPRWRGALRDLAAAKTGQTSGEASIPIDSLNCAIRALVPNVIGIGARAHLEGDRPWILARTEVSSQALLQIGRSWLAAHFSSVAGFRNTHESMCAEDLRGSFADLPLDVGRTAGGTADVNSLLFTLIPNALAAKVAASGRWGEADQPRDLVRVVGGAAAPGEAMTWPPYVFSQKDGDWHYSTVLRFSLQTAPFDAEPVVNLELILRRWLRSSAGGYFRLPRGQVSTVYMRPRVHWIGDSVEAECFQVAPIGWVKEGESYRIDWKDHLGPIMAELAWPRLPNLQALGQDPVSQLNGETPMAIVFDTGAQPEHRVRPGWLPADRRPMFEAAAERLSDWIAPVSLLERAEPPAPRRNRRPSVEMSPKPADKDNLKEWVRERARKQDQAERRDQLESALPGEQRLEILYQHADTLQALRDALTGLLGVPVHEDGAL